MLLPVPIHHRQVDWLACDSNISFQSVIDRCLYASKNLSVLLQTRRTTAAVALQALHATEFVVPGHCKACVGSKCFNERMDCDPAQLYSCVLVEQLFGVVAVDASDDCHVTVSVDRAALPHVFDVAFGLDRLRLWLRACVASFGLQLVMCSCVLSNGARQVCAEYDVTVVSVSIAYLSI